MILASDNWAGVSDKVMDALNAAAKGPAPAYGGDDWSTSAARRFNDVFEREVVAFPVATGTAANAMAISAFSRPGGVVVCHRNAHTAVEEAGAVSFFGGGLSVQKLDGHGGKIAPVTLREALEPYRHDFVHIGQPVALTISELTEWGQVWQPDEIAELAEIAHSMNMIVHVDGARFASAVAATGRSPAELTWKSGVDVMSFGGTKNGCMSAEAVVFFDRAKARDFRFARQRTGMGFSKNWYMTAQFDAYLKDGHWLDLARHANEMGQRVAAAIEAAPDARLALPAPAHQLFARLSANADGRLRDAGVEFYHWTEDGSPDMGSATGDVLVRMVASFQTSEADVALFERAMSGS